MHLIVLNCGLFFLISHNSSQLSVITKSRISWWCCVQTSLNWVKIAWSMIDELRRMDQQRCIMSRHFNIHLHGNLQTIYGLGALELYHKIINYASDNQEALKACSLVSQTLTCRARSTYSLTLSYVHWLLQVNMHRKSHGCRTTESITWVGYLIKFWRCLTCHLILATI